MSKLPDEGGGGAARQPEAGVKIPGVKASSPAHRYAHLSFAHVAFTLTPVDSTLDANVANVVRV